MDLHAAITIARLFSLFWRRFLAVRYGADAMPYLKAHWLLVAVLAVALVLVSYGFPLDIAAQAAS